MKNRVLIYFLVINVALGCSKKTSEFEQLISSGNSFDLLIEGGRIIDGSGGTSYTADVLVGDERIKFIGNVDQSKIEVKKSINASGMVVTPGFIDSHAHGNPLKDPAFTNFLAMGVTTICLGQDGFSEETENFGQWIERVIDTIPAVNIVPFVGHSTLRKLSGINYDTVPDPSQLTEMVQLLDKALKDGVYGMSTGLEYTPGYYAKEQEMAFLAEKVGEYGGVIMSHIRNENDEVIENSINELLRQGRHCKVHVSHLKVVYGKGENRAEQILNLLDSARGKGIRITADVYPYNASYTGIGIVFPEWAKPPNDYQKVLKSRRKELSDFLIERVTKRNGPEATLFGNGPWRGKTLKKVAEELGKPFVEVLMDDIGPNGASGAYFVMDEALQSRLITDSLAAISSDGSPTMHHPRGYGAFGKIIRKFVVEDKLLSLGDAIRKMTGLPASILGLEYRGLLEPGNYADILVFDPKQVKDLATYEEPHQLATGFDYVILNGRVVFTKDKDSPLRFGKMLTKGD